MVKLFVGNLTPQIDLEQIKTLFEQYGKVSECEIIRNYGFVHMDDEQEAKAAFDNLNNHILGGRPIHVEYSTSKLRKDPGMDDVCFRCGARDHKTHNCPVHDGANAGGGGKKRSGSRDDYPPTKYRADNFRGNGENDVPRYRGGYGGRFSPPIPRSAGPYGDYYGRMASASAGTVAYEDPLIPRPNDRLLSPLYEEYLTSRERYYYYRDRLERELYALRRAGGLPPAAPAPPPPSRVTGAAYGAAITAAYGGSVVPSAVGSLPATGLDPYTARSRSPSSIVRYPELYYARQAAAGATTSSAVTVYDYSASVGSANVGLSSGLSANRALYDPYS